MALEEQTVSIRFSGGVETKQDAKGVAATKLLALENGVFTKGISIKKRFGCQPLGDHQLDGDVLPTGPRALAVRGDELVRFADDKAHAYVPSLDQWSEIDDVVSVALSHAPVAKAQAEQTGADYATAGGIGVFAWDDSRGGVYYTVIASATDRVLVRPVQMKSTGSRARCVAIGASVHVYCADATNGCIWVQVISSAQPTLAATPSPTIVVQRVLKSTPAYDATAGEDSVLITWRTADNDVGLAHITVDGEFGAPGNGYPSWLTMTSAGAAITLGPVIAFDPGGTASTRQVLVAYYDGTWVWPRAVRLALTGESGDGIAPGLTPTALALCFTEDDGTGGRHAMVLVSDATETRVGWSEPDDPGAHDAVHLAYGSLASKPFRESGDSANVWVNLVHESTLYTTYLLVRSDGVVGGSYLSGIAGVHESTGHLPGVSTDARTAAWAGLYRMALDSADNDVFNETGIQLVSLDFDSDQQFQAAQLGKSLYLTGGGHIWIYDGDGFVEWFHRAIDDVATPSTANSTGTIDNGTYQYRFSLEFVLSNGEVLRGPVSSGTEVVMAGTDDTVTFAIPTYRQTKMTSPRAEVRIGVWRTEANADVYYRVSSLDPTATGNNGYVENDPSSATVAFVDGMPDATLILQEPLYINGGILRNDPIEAGALIAVGKNRVWTNNASDPLMLHYSQELAEGYAAEFSPALYVKLPPEGGSITGIAVMDDTVVVFKETAIFAFAGPGPLANPDAGGGFSPPTIVPSGVGCIDRRSIAVTPAGVIFQSQKGIWLVDRSLSVTYVGAPIEAYASQEITSAEVLEDRHEVRLLTSGGLTLSWDYLFDQWSTFTNYEGLNAALVDGTYYYLRSDGGVWQETVDAYADGKRPIVLALETAWVKLRDVLQGFQMIWNLEILGEWKSSHTLKCFIQFDYEPGWYGAPWVLGPIAERVVWEGLDNVADDGLTITKNDGTDDTWDAGASSVQSLDGNGFLEVLLSGHPAAAVGFSHAVAKTLAGLEAGFQLGSAGALPAGPFTGRFRVTEGGTAKTSWTNYADGDTLRVEIIDGKVFYLYNGEIVYESGLTMTRPVYVDAAIYTIGDSVQCNVCQYDAQEYGGGNYGEGPYGGKSGTHGYQFKLHVAEECEAFRVRFEFHDTRGLYGACAELSELLVHGAVTGPRKTLGNGRSY